MVVQRIQVRDEALNSRMVGRCGQVPVQAGIMVPRLPLTELAAHEQQLLARLQEHIGQ